MLVQGVAMSTFFVSMVTLTLNGVPGQLVPQASGLYNFMRITAGGFAASVVGTLWEQTATMHQSRLSEVMGASDPSLHRRAAEAAGRGARRDPGRGRR